MNPENKRKLISVLVLMSTVYLIDVVMMGLPAFTLIVLLIGLPAHIVSQGIRRARKASKGIVDLRFTLIPIGIFIVLIASSIGLDILYGESQAKDLISACQKYQADRGTFPDRLEQLVPDYLPAVPSARIFPGINERFKYWRSQEDGLHTILWSYFGFYHRWVALETGQSGGMG